MGMTTRNKGKTSATTPPPQDPETTNQSPAETKKRKRKEITNSQKNSAKNIITDSLNDSQDSIADEVLTVDEVNSQDFITEEERPQKYKNVNPQQPTYYVHSTLDDGFYPSDWKFLTTDFNRRFYNDKKAKRKVGCAVVYENPNDHKKNAIQYDIPYPSDDDVPQPVHLSNFEQTYQFGAFRYTARDSDGTLMVSKRKTHTKFSVNGVTNEADIHYFSEHEEGKEIFWGESGKIKDVFKTNPSKRQKKELEKEINEISAHKKGGNGPLTVKRDDAMKRHKIKTRKPDQNTVMKRSAKDAYAEFLSMYGKELSSDMKEFVKKAIEVHLGDNRRPEWLHAYGHGLTPLDLNPQVPENLGAAPKWVNTRMILAEETGRWCTINADYTVTIDPTFKMLLDTDLIERVLFEVNIKKNQDYVSLIQDIDAFLRFPSYNKITDVALTAATTYSILNDVTPSSVDVIDNAKDVPNKSHNVILPKGAQAPTIKININPPVQQAQPNPPPVQVVPAPQQIPPAPAPVVPPSSSDQPDEQSPSYFKTQKSLVKLRVAHLVFDPSAPWNAPKDEHSRSTGFVIEKNGKKYIITNGHCVKKQTRVDVQLANTANKTRYEAKVLAVGDQCDLALLEVDDPEFNASVEPLKIGKMAKLGETVRTIGFPWGGQEPRISKGVASRIDIDKYVNFYEQEMLVMQIDAAINAGNSGGPVLNEDNEIVGVAFQGYEMVEGMNYIIPVQILEHFLKDIFKSPDFKFNGFPILPVHFESLENDNLRKHTFKLQDNQTGISVRSVYPNTDAAKKLKPRDVLLEIFDDPNWLKISNEGKLKIREVSDSVDIMHCIHKKYIGEEIKVRVQRLNEKNEPEIHEIGITLDTIPLQRERIPSDEYDKHEYLIRSGLCFFPLTRDFINNGEGAEFENMMTENGVSFIDAPQVDPDDQVILIGHVFNCKETDGINPSLTSFVKTIDGNPIKNIRDVKKYLDKDPPNGIHEIVLSDNNIVAIPKLDSKRHREILSMYRIKQDCSDNLLEDNQAKISSNPPPQAPLSSSSDNNNSATVEQPKILKPSSGGFWSTPRKSVQTAEKSAAAAQKPQSTPLPRIDTEPDALKKNKRKRNPEKEEEDNIFEALKGKPLPSERRLVNTIARMENFYSSLPKEKNGLNVKGDRSLGIEDLGKRSPDDEETETDEEYNDKEMADVEDIEEYSDDSFDEKPTKKQKSSSDNSHQFKMFQPAPKEREFKRLKKKTHVEEDEDIRISLPEAVNIKKYKR